MLTNPKIDIKFPPKFRCIFQPARYKVFYGGRGSGKSHSVARYLVVRALQGPVRILCAREFQNSIQDSVHKLISDLIKGLGLSAQFEIQRSTIRCKPTGAEMMFAGIAQNIESIKSMEGIDIVWVEEAERVSNLSWDVLPPTIRKPGSEIILTFNPRFVTDPTYMRFIASCPPNTIREKVNYTENPYFPDVLKQEMEFTKSIDLQKYRHVWEGETRSFSDACIFGAKVVVEEFTVPDPRSIVFRYGADWGFAKDPTALVRCYVDEGDLFISHEAYGYGLDLKDIPALFRTIPGASRAKIWADCSRPETISFLTMPENGHFNIEGAPKWSGSVEDGIEFIRSFKRIVIHPRCKNLQYEATAYRYKVDAVTEEILPIPVDEHNHGFDALRYALNPLITRGCTIYDKEVLA